MTERVMGTEEAVQSSSPRPLVQSRAAVLGGTGNLQNETPPAHPIPPIPAPPNEAFCRFEGCLLPNSEEGLQHTSFVRVKREETSEMECASPRFMF